MLHRKKKPIRKLLLGILGIVSLIILTVIFNPLSPPDYQAISCLDGKFVVRAQEAEKVTGTEWTWLAAYYYVKRDYKTGDPEPTLSELISSAEVLKDSRKARENLGLTKEQWKAVQDYHKRFKRTGYLFSRAYFFPLGNVQPRYEDTWQASREGGKRVHEGTDLFAPQGTEVFAVTNGHIEKMGFNPLGGERIGLRGEDGFYYYYAHLSGYAPNLKSGMKINRGQLLGYVGHTGNAQNTPDHLHFGMCTPYGQWINPYHFLVYWSNQ
ncbi:MAG: metalloendopeptidase [Peptococcaceae bacterium]|jgi:murein DD-endopeptidase MepM/ murein hydrolase activator NlpD|uniref:Peptidoglycan DD-metalloendopeptidase family protein n=1 Tax=Thermanaerosceptrum fracticalcis TaxID=1712410 RepID=A0A7G6E3E7_THEFR|nr:M23 family metallopeptidase [Thermanaerosceptrum fracticalcis]MBZ4654161.1 metalloendopeptidase [Peptococcaceae bacterium]QNB46601.1 peptidoglycan DD-metalloendopeptidase family protein [Thermanaerosceptrum fracticalcis]